MGTAAATDRRTPAVRAGLLAVLTLSGLLEFVKLSQNGYANVYYSAAVKSMLRSWHNFFFIASDPHGLVTIDKPPLGLWLQALSAKIFGFAPLSLIVPEGVCAVLAVALIYRVVAPRFGDVAGLTSAAALAVFPSFVAVSRENGLDSLLILLMLAACAAALRAIDSGRLAPLALSGALAGLAFNTKALAAVLVVPGIAVAWLYCAPAGWRARVGKLALAGAVMVIVGGSWTAAVELTPASARPFIGSTSSNSELDLAFGYNGFGRVGGQQGGPGSTKIYPQDRQPPLVRPGLPGNVPESAVEKAWRAGRRGPQLSLPPRPAPAAGRQRARSPVAFASDAKSPVRIFGVGLGDQAGWIVPLAVLGALALLPLLARPADRRTGALLALGGWFAIELGALDFSSGIVHPYYASALGPGLAAMTGAGSVQIAAMLRSERPRTAIAGYALAVAAVVCTVGVQLFLIHRYGDPTWWRLPLIVLAAGALVAIPMLRGRGEVALGAAVLVLLVAPAAYSFSVWLAPESGTFPTAGPYNYAGHGGVGVSPLTVVSDRSLIAFLRAHGASSPYPLLTESADQASPLILLGLDADTVGGYNATDPIMSAERLADLVAAGRARYLWVGGPYADRGGNPASNAARLACPEVPAFVWSTHSLNPTTSYLVDCAGRAAQLRHPQRFARRFLRAHPRLHYAI
jgi:4-amino-4-deoxy-L-arabinose transferase-like glycosyltransferase